MSLLPADVQSLSPDAMLELFEISGYNTAAPAETLYLCNFIGVVFEGVEYAPVGCESEGYDLIGNGPIATPRLIVSNVGRIVSDWLYQAKTLPGYRLEGSSVTRRLTQRQFLDGQPNSSASIKELPRSIFVLDQVEEETYQAVKFRLGSPFDVQGVTLPARPALRSCGWRYRSAECSYAGTAMYDLNNNSTGDPSKDQCAKTLSACEKRFGTYATLPFGGFPGLNSFG